MKEGILKAANEVLQQKVLIGMVCNIPLEKWQSLSLTYYITSIHSLHEQQIEILNPHLGGRGK